MAFADRWIDLLDFLHPVDQGAPLFPLHAEFTFRLPWRVERTSTASPSDDA
jgi:hypothetical protein